MCLGPVMNPRRLPASARAVLLEHAARNPLTQPAPCVTFNVRVRKLVHRHLSPLKGGCLVTVRVQKFHCNYILQPCWRKIASPIRPSCKFQRLSFSEDRLPLITCFKSRNRIQQGAP